MLVDISSAIPDLIVDLRYKSKNNITGITLYDSDFTAKLEEVVINDLKIAETDFNILGYKLVIWDAYRPAEVQEKLREVCNDDRYVAEISNHTKGISVDVTLMDLKNGELLDMGGDHDEFGRQSISNIQSENRYLLSRVMKKNNFIANDYEWWHFDYGVNNES